MVCDSWINYRVVASFTGSVTAGQTLKSATERLSRQARAVARELNRLVEEFEEERERLNADAAA
jgi:hypothetical protein